MFKPTAQMANKGVSSYEHMQGSPRRAHEGSQSSVPYPEKASNAGLHESAPHDAGNYSGPGSHNLGM